MTGAAFRNLSAVLSAAILACWPCAAQPSLEYEVKAAFLLNFTRFIDWPQDAFASDSSAFAICILGKDPFGAVIDEIVKGEAVKGRGLVVRRIAQAPAPQTCQVVFLDASRKDVAKDLAGLGRGILTVGEGENFVRDGGMIGFVIEDRRVRFDINRRPADAAGLKLSSRLLSVAHSVKQ